MMAFAVVPFFLWFGFIYYLVTRGQQQDDATKKTFKVGEELSRLMRIVLSQDRASWHKFLMRLPEHDLQVGLSSMVS